VIKRLKTKALLLIASVAAATLAATGTASAADVSLGLYRSGQLVGYAYSYGTNGAVAVCDTRADDHGVSVQYERQRSDGPATVTNVNGAGQGCVASSHDESNPIHKIRVCLGAPSNGICTDWYLVS